MMQRALLGLLCGLAFLGGPRLLAQARATVEGTVINPVTQAGVAGVEVRMYTQQGELHVGNTDSGGRFHFPGVVPGTYRFTLEKEDFEQPPVKPGDSGLRIDSTRTVTLTLEIMPFTVLHGRVIDAEGAAVEGASVEAVPAAGIGMRQQARTGPEGEFTIERLLPGAYELITAPPMAQPSADGTPEIETPAGPTKIESEDQAAQNGPTMQSVTTFYPDALEPAQAQPVRLTGLGEEPFYEIRLRRVRVYRVSGQVTDEAGNPVAGANVMLMRPENASAITSRLGDMDLFLPVSIYAPAGEPAITGDDGSFVLPAVPEGLWTLRAASDWGWDEATNTDLQQVGGAEVNVVRENLDELNITVEQNFHFTGIAEYPTGAGLTGPLFGSVMLSSVDGGNMIMGTTSPPRRLVGTRQPEARPGDTDIDAPLYFEQAHSGRYRVLPMFGRLPGLYVEAVESGGRNVLDQVIDLSPASPPLRLIFREGAGSIRILWPNNVAPADSAQVVLIPEAGLPGEYIRTQPCSSTQPTCEFPNLRPGRYTVAAFDRVDRNLLADPVLSGQLTRFGERVTVGAGANMSVELRVGRWPN